MQSLFRMNLIFILLDKLPVDRSFLRQMLCDCREWFCRAKRLCLWAGNVREIWLNSVRRYWNVADGLGWISEELLCLFYVWEESEASRLKCLLDKFENFKYFRWLFWISTVALDALPWETPRNREREKEKHRFKILIRQHTIPGNKFNIRCYIDGLLLMRHAKKEEEDNRLLLSCFCVFQTEQTAVRARIQSDREDETLNERSNQRKIFQFKWNGTNKQPTYDAWYVLCIVDDDDHNEEPMPTRVREFWANWACVAIECVRLNWMATKNERKKTKIFSFCHSDNQQPNEDKLYKIQL